MSAFTAGRLPTGEPLRALLLDFDGVVLDSEPLHERALLDLYAARGWPVEDPRFFGFKGRTEAVNFAAITGRFGGVLEAHRGHYQRAFMALVATAPLVPGVEAFVRRARAAGARVALVTSGRRATVDLVFGTHGLHGLFDAAVVDTDVTHAKPHPEPYLAGATRLGVPPAACLAVEDAVHGLHSALAAGCTAVGLATTFPADVLADAGAHRVVPSFDALGALLWPSA